MSERCKPLIILGAGDYAQEVAWIVDDLNAAAPTWDLLGFVDPPASGRSEHYGRRVFAGYEAVRQLGLDLHFVCGVARPEIRLKECEYAESLGWVTAAVIHPSVIRARFCEVGTGTAIGAGTVIAPNARIGRHCAINVQATIGHDAVIGDYTVISPGVRISGHVTLEQRVFIGANASVYQGRSLGAGSRLGANSFLHADLPSGQTALGVPARPFLPAPGGAQ